MSSSLRDFIFGKLRSHMVCEWCQLLKLIKIYDMSSTTSKLLRPLTWLEFKNVKDTVLVLLNQKIEELQLLKKLWQNVLFKSCVDGAANRLYDAMSDDKETFIPDIITGDFDSITPSVLEFYKMKGTAIVETPDQNKCDYTKALLEVLNRTKDSQFEHILTFGGIGGHLDGRPDHLFGNINTLFEMQQLTEKPIYIASQGSLVCLLSKGSTIIQLDTGYEGSTCGLIPIGSPCDHVTTTGLKWNLNNQSLKFGDFISTSNTFEGEKAVTVETDKPLLWTMSYNNSI